MPFYVYRCTSGHVHDEVRKIDYRNYPSTCPVCKMDATRFLGGEHVNAQNDFEHPVYSEALGVHPSQVAEAKRKVSAPRVHEQRPDGHSLDARAGTHPQGLGVLWVAKCVPIV
jgi:hypothetical protein